MSEWSKERDWKSRIRQRIVGSNPTHSAISVELGAKIRIHASTLGVRGRVAIKVRTGRSRRYASAALLILSLAGLVTPAIASEKKTILVWGQTLGPDTKGTEAVVREFERRNPEYRVRVLGMGAGEMNPQKLMTAIVGRVPPDVIHQDRFTISDWAKRGAFRPLDDLIANDQAAGVYTPGPDTFYPAAWAEAQFDGKQYGIPTDADDRALYYSKAIFQEKAADLRKAGLDPDRPPRTWSEILAYSKVLTEFNKDGSLKRAGFIPNFGNSWLYLFAFQNNAEFMSPDGRRCTLNSPPAVEALQFMIDGYDILGGYEAAQKFQTGFQGGENDPFMVGKVAMKIDGDWILYGLAKYAPHLNFYSAPPPVPDDRYYRRGRFANEKDQFVTWIGGFSYAIPNGAREIEGAWKFIKFATSTEGHLLDMRAQREWERLRGRIFIPRVKANIKTNEVAFVEFRPADKKFADVVKLNIELMNVARIRPATFVGQVLWDEHVRAIEQACLKKVTPTQALQAGQDRVQRLLDEVFNERQYSVVDLRVPMWLGLGGFLLGCALLFARFRSLNLGALARQEARWAYLFIAPWAIGFVIFTLGPMLASMFFSFTQYNVLNDARWVGTKNFADVFGSDWQNISKALSNVLYISGVGVPLGLVTGLAIALLLNSAVNGMRVYRTAFYVPAIVPTTAAVVLWLWILTPDPSKGVFNNIWSHTILPWFGVQPPGWHTAEAWAKPTLIIMGLWGAGSGMILWLAGLKGIPATLYEAANIDGASPWQQFWNVTLPQLSPIIFFNTVMGFIGAIQTFDSIYIITKGLNSGPADSLLMPVYHLFTNAFNYFRMGYASALAWVIFAIILLLTLIQFKLAPRWVHYEADK